MTGYRHRVGTVQVSTVSPKRVVQGRGTLLEGREQIDHLKTNRKVEVEFTEESLETSEGTEIVLLENSST